MDILPHILTLKPDWNGDEPLLDIHIEKARTASSSHLRRLALYEAQRRSGLFPALLDALVKCEQALEKRDVEAETAAVKNARYLIDLAGGR